MLLTILRYFITRKNLNLPEGIEKKMKDLKDRLLTP